jgi:hypothetical protein
MDNGHLYSPFSHGSVPVHDCFEVRRKVHKLEDDSGHRVLENIELTVEYSNVYGAASRMTATFDNLLASA